MVGLFGLCFSIFIIGIVFNIINKYFNIFIFYIINNNIFISYDCMHVKRLIKILNDWVLYKYFYYYYYMSNID